MTPADREQLVQRIAALLLTMPGWNRNYTSTIEAAGWMADEAERVGWDLSIDDAATEIVR